MTLAGNLLISVNYILTVIILLEIERGYNNSYNDTKKIKEGEKLNMCPSRF